ncbi:MAG: aspartate carbamoyltransferase [Kiritimatiellia bacterium]|nr:aspartate carbamoyltransferase [Lentisphaerota bacterium]
MSKTGAEESLTWEELREMGPRERAREFEVYGRLFHVLLAQQFDRALLDELGVQATRIRHIAKSKAGMDFLRSQLSHKTAMLYFTQPSSRTFLSFHSACQMLGMKTVEVRDTATSSEIKGETQEDSIRTFSSFADVVIMRTAVGGLAEKMAWMLSHTERPIPIINAGSGKDQHPTQALLDVYTLQRSFEKRGGIDNKTVLFVGDLARGRTVRSLAQLLTNYRGVRQLFVAPPQLQIGADILELLDAAGVQYELGDDFEAMLPRADAIYMTRIQDEWDQQAGESRQLDLARYNFGVRHLKLMLPHAVLMHPLPRRQEIATEVDGDSRAVYWRQVRNGMWVRAALLARIFNCCGPIREFHGA